MGSPPSTPTTMAAAPDDGSFGLLFFHIISSTTWSILCSYNFFTMAAWRFLGAFEAIASAQSPSKLATETARRL